MSNLLLSAGSAVVIAVAAVYYWTAQESPGHRAMRTAQVANTVYDCGFSDAELKRFIKQAQARGVPDPEDAVRQVVDAMAAGCAGPQGKTQP